MESLSFGCARLKRLLSRLRLLGLSKSSEASESGSSVSGRVVNFGSVPASSFPRDPFRHPCCGDWDRARTVLDWTESSFVSSPTDKTFARGSFGGGPLRSIWAGAFEDDAIHFVLEISSRATGKTGSKGWWKAIFIQPLQLMLDGMN